MSFWPGIGPTRQIATGVYVDRWNNLHIEAGEVLRSLGYDDTPDARAALVNKLGAQVPASLPAART